MPGGCRCLARRCTTSLISLCRLPIKTERQTDMSRLAQPFLNPIRTNTTDAVSDCWTNKYVRYSNDRNRNESSNPENGLHTSCLVLWCVRGHCNRIYKTNKVVFYHVYMNYAVNCFLVQSTPPMHPWHGTLDKSTHFQLGWICIISHQMTGIGSRWIIRPGDLYTDSEVNGRSRA